MGQAFRAICSIRYSSYSCNRVARSIAAGGLGVGLTLVRSLVKMHGGTVSASSDGEGKGSEFVVRLPLTSEKGTVEPVQMRTRPLLLEGSKIIIVEDNADSREMLCELLAQAGFQCRAAESGRAALSLIDEVNPQIAILDVGLPEMDGFEVARRIRASTRHADMWLIALTGYGQASDRMVGRNAGFDEHLVKPVDTEQLLQLLNEMQNAAARRPDRSLNAQHPVSFTSSSAGGRDADGTAWQSPALERDDN